jgi:hypothetical protein
VERRSGLDFPSDYIAREARAADLLVIGRHFRSEDLFRSLDPGELILKVQLTGQLSVAEAKIIDPSNCFLAGKQSVSWRQKMIGALSTSSIHF